MRLPGDSQVRVGELVALGVEAAAVFDAASGQRLALRR
jgi:hypothetical protein